MSYGKVLCLFMFLSFAGIRGDISLKVDLTASKEDIRETVLRGMPAGFCLKDFKLKADNRFSEKEFLYLADVRKGEAATGEQFASALAHLHEKDQFDRAIITGKTCEDGFIIEIELESDWILANVGIKGIAFGASRYLQYYQMQPGDRFKLEKHHSSIEKLQEVFRQRGYKDVQIIEKIKRNNHAKKVYVTLQCLVGKQFSIGSVTVMVSDTNGPINSLQRELENLLSKGLSGKRYTDETVNEKAKTIQELLFKRGFAKNSIKLNESTDEKLKTVSLLFTVKVGKQREFNFFGNHFFNQERLWAIIRKFGFSLDSLPSTLLAQEIVAEYHKKGFWQAVVEVHEQEDGTYFVIHEGPRGRVKEVVLNGTQHFESRDLVAKFFTSVTKGRFFDEHTLKQALGSLLTFYRVQGFWDVAVLKRDCRPFSSGVEYRLTVVLDEGKQRLLKSVQIDRFPGLMSQGPFAKLSNVRAPIPFDKAILQEQLNWLLNHFKKQGYLWVKVEPTLIEDESGITILWEIDEGERCTFGKVVLKGSFDVRPSLLKGFLGIKEGEPWSKERVMLGYTRLRELDVFKQIRIYPIHCHKGTCRDLAVYLQNEEPYEIRLRGGFQQVSKNFALKKGSTYKVGSSFLWRNPAGYADLFRADLDLTLFERRFDCSYHVPCLLPVPSVVTFKGYANKYTQPLAAGSRKTLYKVTQEGFLNSFSSHTRHTNSALTSGFEWMETYDISSDLADAINFKADLVNKKIPYFFIEPSIFIDLLDEKINPTKGLFLAASLKGMFPLKASSYFVKLLVEKGMFFPLVKNRGIICAARIRFGHIFQETFSKIMPPERFYLGGANSLRGYLPDSCPPLGTFTDDQGNVQRVPQGGKSMVNMNFEIRVPLAKQFDGVLFQDFGVLVEDIADLSYGNNNLAATGFGIRYQTSIGPLRFDIGWKWQKPFPEDTAYAWFLTFGHAF